MEKVSLPRRLERMAQTQVTKNSHTEAAKFLEFQFQSKGFKEVWRLFYLKMSVTRSRPYKQRYYMRNPKWLPSSLKIFSKYPSELSVPHVVNNNNSSRYPPSQKSHIPGWKSNQETELESSWKSIEKSSQILIFSSKLLLLFAAAVVTKPNAEKRHCQRWNYH